MNYRIKFGPNTIADLAAEEPLRKSAGIVVNDKVFTAPPGWIAAAATDAIPGYVIEAYEPAPPPPPPAPTSWSVSWLTFLDRLSDANANAARAFVNGLDAKISERVKREGIPVDTVAPSGTETQLRTWLTNNGEDPDAILAVA